MVVRAARLDLLPCGRIHKVAAISRVECGLVRRVVDSRLRLAIARHRCVGAGLLLRLKGRAIHYPLLARELARTHHVLKGLVARGLRCVELRLLIGLQLLLPRGIHVQGALDICVPGRLHVGVELTLRRSRDELAARRAIPIAEGWLLEHRSEVCLGAVDDGRDHLIDHVTVARVLDPDARAIEHEFLRRLPAAELVEARRLLVEHFGGVDLDARRGRIALVGLRGAGKSTLGAMLADRLEAPFLELDRLIEQESGVSLSVIFDLYGQSGFRRLERRVLDQVIERYPRFVLATGGSLVSEPATFERLLTMCFTVWLRATPEEHMQRVIAQGDMRPMADNRESMSDLRRILDVREPLYRKADATINTSGCSAKESSEMLEQAIRES